MDRSGLLLLTRPDCTLCDEFQQEYAIWAEGRDLPPLRLQDVDSDPQQRRRYGLQIPVLLCDGALACATRFDSGELERLLRARGSR